MSFSKNTAVLSFILFLIFAVHLSSQAEADKMVRTLNYGVFSQNELLHKSTVVLVGENHVNVDHHAAAREIINRFGKDGDYVLLEGLDPNGFSQYDFFRYRKSM